MPMLFQTFAETLDALEAITGRIQMTNMTADLLKQAEPDEVGLLVYLTQGLLAPEYRQKEFGINERLAMRSVAQANGVTAEQTLDILKKLGDAGLVAQRCRLDSDGDNPAPLAEGGGPTVGDVHAALSDIAEATGSGSMERKVTLLAELLKKLTPLGAKHATRCVVGRLRVGVREPTMLDALSIARCGDKSLRPALERAYNISSDLGRVAETLYRDGIEAVSQTAVSVGNPVLMALAERADSVEEIIAKLGRCAVEPKFDGFRCQIHKNGDDVKIFSRGLENMTGMFPEIAEATVTQFQAETAIFEGEALALDTATGRYLPFQETTKRRRVHNIEAMSASLPLQLVAFDLLFKNGEDLTQHPYEERRRLLQEAIGEGSVLRVTENLVTEDPEEMALFYDSATGEGLEGMMAKRLSGSYDAGKRGYNWIKLKRSYNTALRDTVDLAVVGYYYGKGARASWGIGSLLCAVYNPADGTFPTVTRCASGLSNQGWIELGQRLAADVIDHPDPLVVARLTPDVWVLPRYVFEIQADEVTRSPMHPAGAVENGSGYAMRFPRIVQEREKRPEDATTVEEVISLHNMQGHKGKQSKKAKSDEEAEE